MMKVQEVHSVRRNVVWNVESSEIVESMNNWENIANVLKVTPGTVATHCPQNITPVTIILPAGRRSNDFATGLAFSVSTVSASRLTLHGRVIVTRGLTGTCVNENVASIAGRTVNVVGTLKTRWNTVTVSITTLERGVEISNQFVSTYLNILVRFHISFMIVIQMLWSFKSIKCHL